MCIYKNLNKVNTTWNYNASYKGHKLSNKNLSIRYGDPSFRLFARGVEKKHKTK